MQRSFIYSLLGAILIIVTGLVYYVFRTTGRNNSAVTPTAAISNISVSSFDDCVAAGYPVKESYPPQCTAPKGRTFTQYIGNELDVANDIKITNPRPNQLVVSPLKIKGEARGTWYFEASFPIKLVDSEDKVIGQVSAQADGDWMTEDFVGFSAEITFSKPNSKIGKLILIKDNPSGLAENDRSLVVPVKFE